MPQPADLDLLRDYERHGSEDAFATLVQRHVNLVYSVALRHLGNPAHAEEVTEAVFVVLARKASTLRPDTILEGWLHETARFTALSFLRTERRRQTREQHAYMQSQLQEPTPNAAWQHLAPLLDEALSRLGQTDRDAVMLRFFKDNSVREVAAALDLNESAAQRRILRAVEKLRRSFARRGVVVSASVITAAISANSVLSAPAALAKASIAIAFAKGATASGSTLSLIKGALNLMAWAKAKTAIAVLTAVILAAGTTTALVAQSRQTSSPKIDLPRSAWTFAGYSSPDATVKTLAWAASRQDAETVFGIFSPACQEEFRQFVTDTHQTVSAEQFLLKRAVSGLAGVDRLSIQSEPLWTNAVLAHLVVVGGKQSGDVWLRMQKIDDDWKIDDLDAKGKNGRTGLAHPNAEYGGIGVGIKTDPQTRGLEIFHVLTNSAASQAGLAPGMFIRKIDGTSTAGKSLSECVFLTRGRVGTTVVLEVFNPELNQTNAIELTRHQLNY